MLRNPYLTYKPAKKGKEKLIHAKKGKTLPFNAVLKSSTNAGPKNQSIVGLSSQRMREGGQPC